MLKVALTGGIGSGKSEIGTMFAKLGAIVLDSDQISREVIERGTPGFDEVISTFGDEILKDGSIDRRKLGEIVFSDPEKRAALQAIIHPRVRERFAKVAADLGAGEVLINEIPLLVETKSANNFDKIIVVSAPIEIRSARLQAKGLSQTDIKKRISAQATEEERIAIADYVIENSNSLEDLQGKIEEIYQELKRDASHN